MSSFQSGDRLKKVLGQYPEPLSRRLLKRFIVFEERFPRKLTLKTVVCKLTQGKLK